MSKSSIIITSANTSGKTMQKTLTDINPYATNEQLATFGQMLNGLSNNTYGKTEKVTKVNCDAEAGGGGKLVPTLTIKTNDDVPIVDGGTYNLRNHSYLDVTNDGDAIVFLSIEPGNGSGYLISAPKNPQNPKWYIDYTSGTYTVSFFAPETENYQAAQISFTATFSA